MLKLKLSNTDGMLVLFKSHVKKVLFVEVLVLKNLDCFEKKWKDIERKFWCEEWGGVRGWGHE